MPECDWLIEEVEDSVSVLALASVLDTLSDMELLYCSAHSCRVSMCTGHAVMTLLCFRTCAVAVCFLGGVSLIACICWAMVCGNVWLTQMHADRTF